MKESGAIGRVCAPENIIKGSEGLMEELKPCPFCRGKARVIKESDPNLIQYKVMCQNCGISTPFIGSREQSEDTWNRRPASESNLLTCAGCKNFEEDNISDTCAECARFVHPDYYARKPEGSEKALATKTK